jgi:hypothetical protein
MSTSGRELFVVERGVDDLERSLGLLQDELISKSHDANTASTEEVVALFIVRLCAGCVVNVAVDFDDESGIAAEEVDDVRPQRMLASKLGSERPATEECPERALGGSAVSAQRARTIRLRTKSPRHTSRSA